jgi:hypothetical protein
MVYSRESILTIMFHKESCDSSPRLWRRIKNIWKICKNSGLLFNTESYCPSPPDILFSTESLLPALFTVGSHFDSGESFLFYFEGLPLSIKRLWSKKLNMHIEHYSLRKVLKCKKCGMPKVHFWITAVIDSGESIFYLSNSDNSIKIWKKFDIASRQACWDQDKSFSKKRSKKLMRGCLF